jgi:hypothetical protein
LPAAATTADPLNTSVGAQSVASVSRASVTSLAATAPAHTAAAAATAPAAAALAEEAAAGLTSVHETPSFVDLAARSGSGASDGGGTTASDAYHASESFDGSALTLEELAQRAAESTGVASTNGTLSLQSICFLPELTLSIPLQKRLRPSCRPYGCTS